MAEIDHLDRSDAIALAKKMRNKVRNLEVDKKSLGLGAVRTAISAGSAYAMGRYMGGLEAEYLAIQSEVEAGTADDPRKMAGIDKDGLIGAGLVVAGLSAIAASKGKDKMQKAADYFLAAGDGVLSGYLYNMGMRQGIEDAQSAT